jgi:putative heme-binding domain-containing protein
MLRIVLVALVVALSVASLAQGEEVSPLQRSKDRLKVQTLVRLMQFDLSDKPELKAAVLRHVETLKGTDEYLDLVGKFQLAEAKEELARLMIDKFDSSQGVDAARLLSKFGAKETLAAAIASKDETAAGKAISVVGQVGDAGLNDILLPVMNDVERNVAMRSAALAAIGRNGPGQQMLLDLVKEGKLAKELNFAAANVLLTSADEKIKVEAGKHLMLPATADSKPLPPVAELVKREGDASHGKTLFAGVGTCGKCHKVAGEGKDVGPDLSEIGSKLSKEALYVSILDPSAGINFNYETSTILLADGTVLNGIVVSQTDDEVTVKTAEAIVRKIPRDEIDDMKKQAISLMPQDLQKSLTAENLVDVVEYLTTLKKPGG